jgi:hypothetical protein
MEQRFESIEDEIVHILGRNGSRMTAADIFGDCSMAEDERSVANAMYRMKLAGKVVPDGKLWTKILYRLPDGQNQNPIKKPEREPIAPKISQIVDSVLPQVKEPEESLPKPPAKVNEPVQADGFDTDQVNWWISRDLTVRIDMPGGLSIQLKPDDALDLADAINRANDL